ncbi:MAG: tRNA lysidine(34) synthetase TilS [Rhizobiales bacterium]|nr:tRNA lysidine(34) synthetase TilS [Hyphomicrobiales bacterium]
MPGADQHDGLISQADAGQLLAPLGDYDHLVLAVSGGSDSVALMVLAADWIKACAKAPKIPKISVLTVDHGLRADAAGEAAQVGGWARALGFEHETLTWHGAKPASGVQAAAREARYALMSDWCLANRAAAIVTAHTADDQAETVLMRLARGSGVDGLAGMLSETGSPWPVLRPLLGVTRAQLRSVLMACGQDWIDDPSNDDEGFERIRVRKALAELAPLGLNAQSIALSARRLARARHALELGAAALLREVFVGHEAGFGEVDLHRFQAAPEELQLRVLQRLVWQFGDHGAPRMAALERVADWIAGAPEGRGRARTVSGCRIVRRRHQLIVGREAGRIEPVPVALKGGKEGLETVWDRRFKVIVHGAKASDELSIAPFCAVSAPQNHKFDQKFSQMPAFVRDGLPVLLDHGELHSVPHLGISGVNMNPRLSVDVSFMTH